MSKIEGFTSLSSLEKRSAGKYYLFILVNVFLGSIVTGTALQQLNTFLNEPPTEYVALLVCLSQSFNLKETVFTIIYMLLTLSYRKTLPESSLMHETMHDYLKQWSRNYLILNFSLAISKEKWDALSTIFSLIFFKKKIGFLQRIRLANFWWLLNLYAFNCYSAKMFMT